LDKTAHEKPMPPLEIVVTKLPENLCIASVRVPLHRFARIGFAANTSGMRLRRICIGFSLLFFLCCGGSEPGGGSGVITVGGVSATQGGTLASDSGEVKLQVPSGALDIPDNPATGDAQLQVEVRAADAETAGPIYKFSPEGLVFRTPATLSIRLDKEVPAGKIPVIALREGDSWMPYPGSVVE